MSNPHVLISGGGVAGLFLGILLEHAGVSYEIFERAAAVKPLGAIMSLNVNILPALEQVGILDELMKVSFTSPAMHIFDESLKKLTTRSNDNFEEMFGYQYIVFSRIYFYDLLLSKIPPHKIHFSKRVLVVRHEEDHVEIQCSDNATHHGTILVGADGTYSAVRHCLYKDLKDQEKLPEKDKEELSIGYLTMVGTSDSMDEEKYPVLKDDFTHFNLVIGKGKPYTWSTFTVPGKKFCWSAQVQLPAAEAKKMAFRNSQWAPETNDEMIKEIRDFPTPHGDLGQFIDATPKANISRVFLEEKMFHTWYHQRTVLIGDAAHKMLPSAGQGAVNALQDAVILANCLYDIVDWTPKNITAAFQDYKEQRYPHVKFQFDSSKLMASVIFGQKWSERLLRKIVFGYLPKSIMHKDTVRAASYRPQATFLPFTPNRGTYPVLPQKMSKRYAQEQADRQRQQKALPV